MVEYFAIHLGFYMIGIRRIVVLFFTLAAFSLQAEDFNDFTTYKSSWLNLNQGNGLIINIPARKTHEVIGKVQKFHSELYAKQRKYREEVENSQIKTKDTLIAVIVPGGLIYLASKKQRNIQAKEGLDSVSLQLSSLENDLGLLKTAYSKESVALLK